jgi:hypothetical protein
VQVAEVGMVESPKWEYYQRYPTIKVSEV